MNSLTVGWIVLIVAWVFVIVWISMIILNQRKHHPAALFYLFFTELWERFSYYGMRALLILYMTKGLLVGDSEAYGVYGAYGALVYATPVLGGVLADKFLGFKNSIILGGILMALGHFALAFDPLFFIALGFLIIGNGFFKPNISSMIGTFYEQGDPRRDSAFTIFYMGINTGAFLTPLTCGFIGETYGWHWGFGLAGIGMVLGLVIFLIGNSRGVFMDKGLSPLKGKPEAKYNYIIIILAFASVALFSWLVNHHDIAEWSLYILIAGVLIILLVIALLEKKVQRERLIVLMLLFIFSTMFWTFFELAGSSISLFTERNVDRVVLNTTLATSIFQSVNPFFIIVLAPVFAWLWEALAKRGHEPSAPKKFSYALIQLGIGFAILVLGSFIAGPDARAPLMFLIFAYLLHTTGELCISPIGLSLVTKLSPASIVGFVMGVWLLSSSLAHLVGANISKLTALPVEEGVGDLTLEMRTKGLTLYADVFWIIALVAVGSGILLMIVAPALKKWMHGVK